MTTYKCPVRGCPKNVHPNALTSNRKKLYEASVIRYGLEMTQHRFVCHQCFRERTKSILDRYLDNLDEAQTGTFLKEEDRATIVKYYQERIQKYKEDNDLIKKK